MLGEKTTKTPYFGKYRLLLCWLVRLLPSGKARPVPQSPYCRSVRCGRAAGQRTRGQTDGRLASPPTADVQRRSLRPWTRRRLCHGLRMPGWQRDSRIRAMASKRRKVFPILRLQGGVRPAK